MDGGKSCRTAGKVCAGLGRGRTCRLRRRFEIAVLWGLANFGARRFPKGERKALWCARRRILIAPAGLTRRLRRGRWGCRPVGGSTFFRSERKYQRKHAARRLRRRPTSLRAVGFGLREPNGWTPRIYSGRPIPAVRPEQSDHVPWADCPQGLSSSTGCPVSHSSLPVALLASHPPCGSLWAAPKAPLGPRFPSGQFASLTRREKALYCPFLKEGVRNVARSIVG